MIRKDNRVKEAHILVTKDLQNHKSLVAFIIADCGTDLSSDQEKAVRKSIEKDLQLHCDDGLPKYMQPSYYCFIEEMPYNLSDKVDKIKLEAIWEKETLTTTNENYVPPRNSIEQKLIEIWEELLGLEKVGIKDNFFEMGGDSIVTMQVVSRAKRAGIPMRPRDIFELQTIGAIAEAIKEKQETVKAEQGILNGLASLSPIQQFYFENEYCGDDHYNQAVLLEIDKKVEVNLLSEAIKAIVQRHDALRFKYDQSPDQNTWQQAYSDVEAELTTIDFSQSIAAHLVDQITHECAALQTQMNLAHGQLFKALLIQTPEQEPNNRLFLAIQHLAVDGVSWRILLEELENALTALFDKAPIRLGNKTASYREWVDSLKIHAASDTVGQQLPYWQSVIQKYEALPTDLNLSLIHI